MSGVTDPHDFACALDEVFAAADIRLQRQQRKTIIRACQKLFVQKVVVEGGQRPRNFEATIEVWIELTRAERLLHLAGVGSDGGNVEVIVCIPRCYDDKKKQDGTRVEICREVEIADEVFEDFREAGLECDEIDLHLSEFVGDTYIESEEAHLSGSEETPDQKWQLHDVHDSATALLLYQYLSSLRKRLRRRD